MRHARPAVLNLYLYTLLFKQPRFRVYMCMTVTGKLFSRDAMMCFNVLGRSFDRRMRYMGIQTWNRSKYCSTCLLPFNRKTVEFVQPSNHCMYTFDKATLQDGNHSSATLLLTHADSSNVHCYCAHRGLRENARGHRKKCSQINEISADSAV